MSVSVLQEEKYLKAIGLTIERPYFYTPRKLAAASKLSEANAKFIARLLFLDTIGQARKNKRNEVRIFIEDNPDLLPQEICDVLGVSLDIVYQVKKEFKLKTATKWERK